MLPRPLASGPRFDVFVLDRGDHGRVDQPAWEWLRSLPPERRGRMLHIVQKHATSGPLLNVQVPRDLGDNIYEFKTMAGDRLLYFYDPDRRTVLTNGFSKRDSLRVAKSRAMRMREEWRKWNSPKR